MAVPSILIVEDEAEIGALIQLHVQRAGFDARVIASGRDALEEIRRSSPRLIILDLMLPDLDGLEVCRQLRWSDAFRSIPILIVSARGEESDIVAGLELGADDYVTKPFSPRVLVARVKNILRRLETRDDGPLHRINLADGNVVIDVDRHTVTVKGDGVDFTRTEFAILSFLAARPGFVRTRDQIIAAVHGNSTVLTSRTVDVHMTAIRRKLGDLSPLIRAVRGVGYRLDEAAVMSEA